MSIYSKCMSCYYIRSIHLHCIFCRMCVYIFAHLHCTFLFMVHILSHSCTVTFLEAPWDRMNSLRACTCMPRRITPYITIRTGIAARHHTTILYKGWSASYAIHCEGKAGLHSLHSLLLHPLRLLQNSVMLVMVMVPLPGSYMVRQ